MGELWRRLRFLMQRRRFDAELQEEMRFHLEMKAAGGADSSAARKQFGNPTLLKEVSREMWGWNSLERLIQDLRYALRMMRRSPGLSTVAILSLALGIGANTAIFTVLNAALLRTLPVKDPQHLILITKRSAFGVGHIFSYPAYVLFRDQSQSLDGIATFISPQRVRMSAGSSGDNPEPITRSFVSGSYFPLLGVQPSLGRLFSATDDQAFGGAPYAVLNYTFWRNRFSLDPGVLGRRLLVDETPVTIVGVAPPGFSGIEPGLVPDLWIPAMMSQRGCMLAPGCQTFQIVARVKPGKPLAQAQAEIEVLHRQHLLMRAKEIPSDVARQKFLSQNIELAAGGRGYSFIGARYSTPLAVLMAVVGMVLLIACANVANLLLARATARQREVAVRLTLGAGRARLARQFLTESLLLALLGGGLGLMLAIWGSQVLVQLAQVPGVRMIFDLRPDLHVLGFNAAVTLTAGLLFGIAPAFRAARGNLGAALKETSRSLAGSSGFNTGKALVVSQVALSMLLLVGAGLFVRSLSNLRNLDIGFERQNVLTFGIGTPKSYREPQFATIKQRLFERLPSLPGVVAVSTASPAPLDGSTWDNIIDIEGRPAARDEDMDTNLSRVSQRFFETLRMPVLAGRAFGPQDTPTSTHVGVVNEAFVRRYFNGASPLGRHVSCKGCGDPVEIVGVVRDAKMVKLRDSVPPTLFFLTEQLGVTKDTFLVRIASSSSALLAALRDLLKTIDPNLTVERPTTLVDQIDNNLVTERVIAKLSGFFGGLALLLASIGLYGVMSYAVVRRTNEIGIRMALGAASGDVLRQILRETSILVGSGIVLGVIGAVSLTHLIKAMLFGLTPNDPVTMTAMALVLLAVALFAGYLPARRAARVDPMVALRYE